MSKINRWCHIHGDDIIKPQGLHIVLTESFHGVPEKREKYTWLENTWLEQHENPLALRFYFIIVVYTTPFLFHSVLEAIAFLTTLIANTLTFVSSWRN